MGGKPRMYLAWLLLRPALAYPLILHEDAVMAAKPLRRPRVCDLKDVSDRLRAQGVPDNMIKPTTDFMRRIIPRLIRSAGVDKMVRIYERALPGWGRPSKPSWLRPSAGFAMTLDPVWLEGNWFVKNALRDHIRTLDDDRTRVDAYPTMTFLKLMVPLLIREADVEGMVNLHKCASPDEADGCSSASARGMAEQVMKLAQAWLQKYTDDRRRLRDDDSM
jgi:hypothetical protein